MIAPLDSYNYHTEGCKLGAQMAGVKLMLDHIAGLH